MSEQYLQSKCKTRRPIIKTSKRFFFFLIICIVHFNKKMILLKNASKLDPHEEYLDIRLRRLFHFPCIWINHYIIWRFRSVRSHTKFWLIGTIQCVTEFIPLRSDNLIITSYCNRLWKVETRTYDRYVPCPCISPLSQHCDWLIKVKCHQETWLRPPS